MGKITVVKDIKDRFVDGQIVQIPDSTSRTGLREVFIGRTVAGKNFTLDDVTSKRGFAEVSS